MRKCLAPVLVWFFTGCLLAAPAFQQNSKDNWKEYSYPSDGFAVSAPEQPVLNKQEKNPAAGTPEVHNYAIELGNNSGVMISNTIFENVQGEPKTLLQNAKNGAIGAMNARIISEKEITLQDYPGIEFVAESENFHIRSRMYMINGRLLTLLALAPNDSTIPATADRVFNSLKLKAPAAEPGKQ